MNSKIVAAVVALTLAIGGAAPAFAAKGGSHASTDRGGRTETTFQSGPRGRDSGTDNCANILANSSAYARADVNACAAW